MTIDYSTLLTEEQKRNLLQQRITQFASEAYQNDLNKQVAIASGNEDGVKAADDALAILETAITVHQDALAAIPAAQ
jgi:hypothetical protein